MSATITSAATMATAAATGAAQIPASLESILTLIPSQALYSLTVSGISPALQTALASGELPPGICIDPPPKASAVHLPGTSVTLHQLMLIVGGICMGGTVLGSLLIFFSHLKWRSTYREQSPVMRITLLPLLYATLSYVSITHYSVGGIVNPISKLYVSYCVASYFNYMVEVILPHHTHAKREDFFIASERRSFFRQSKKHPLGSLRWFRFNSVMVYLSLFVNLIAFAVTEGIAQSWCKTTDKYANAILILNVITACFTILGLTALPRMWWRYRDDHYGETDVLRRFATFKPYVAVIVTQSFIFGVIDYTQSVKPTKYMSQADFMTGIPGFMICCWSFIFIWGFIYTLSGKSYRDSGYKDNEPLWRYVFYWAFPRDIFVGAWVSTLYFLSLLGRHFDYTGGTGLGWTERQEGAVVEENPVIPMPESEEKKGRSVENVTVEQKRHTMMSDSDGDSGSKEGEQEQRQSMYKSDDDAIQNMV